MIYIDKSIKVVIDLLSAEESLAKNVFDRKSSDHIESPPSLFVAELVDSGHRFSSKNRQIEISFLSSSSSSRGLIFLYQISSGNPLKILFTSSFWH
jgi:hypothetical protein